MLIMLMSYGISLVLSIIVYNVVAIITSEEKRYWKDLKTVPHIQWDPDDIHENSSTLMDALEQFEMFSSPKIREVMIKVDRKDFVPPDRYIYYDYPCLIHNCSYLSSPSFIASSLEQAVQKLKPGDTVFDVGTGSGYTAACLSYMVRPGGKVYSMDHIDYLTKWSEENIRKNHAHLLDEGTLTIKCGDARNGFPGVKQFDVVYVGGKMANYQAKQFLRMVKPGGRLILSLKNEIDVLDNLYAVDRYLNDTTKVKFIKQHDEDHSNIWDLGTHKLLIKDFNENVRPVWDHTTFMPYLPPIGTQERIPLVIQSARNERRKFEAKIQASFPHGHKTYSWTPIDFTYLNTAQWSYLREGTFGPDIFPYPDSDVFDLNKP